MSENEAPSSPRSGGLVDVRWIGWLLLAAAAVIVLVAVLGLRGTATRTATFGGGLGDDGSTLPEGTATLSCAAPAHGPTVPATGNGEPFDRIDAVTSSLDSSVTTPSDLDIGHACDQVREARTAHAVTLGGAGALVALGGVGLSLVPPWRRNRPGAP